MRSRWCAAKPQEDGEVQDILLEAFCWVGLEPVEGG